MPTVYILVGIPASGKTTIARRKVKEIPNTVHISSDDIRETMFGYANNQQENHLVFENMRAMTREALKLGKNVVYDATNLSRKRRMGFIKQLPKGVNTEAIYVHTTLEQAKLRNSKRSRVVPEDVILRMYKNLQIPVKGEGYSKVSIVGVEPEHNANDGKDLLSMIEGSLDHDELFKILIDIFPNFADIYNLPQDSSYHKYSASEHTFEVYKAFLSDNPQGGTIDMDTVNIMIACLLHDIGKGITKSFYNRKGEKCEYANYYQHENVSAQMTFDFYKVFPYFDARVVYQLCEFHMYPYDKNYKLDKLKTLLGEDVYTNLLKLHKYDKSGKGV